MDSHVLDSVLCFLFLMYVPNLKEFHKLLLQAAELMKWKASGCIKPAWGAQVSLPRQEQCSAWSHFILCKCHLGGSKTGWGERVLGTVALL